MHAQAEATSMNVPLRLLAQLRLLLERETAAGLQSTALSMPGTLTAEDLSTAPLTRTKVRMAFICCTCLGDKATCRAGNSLGA